MLARTTLTERVRARNFPVDKECVSYRTCWNLFKRIAAKKGLSAAAKASLFSGTACRAYRLPPVDPPKL